jgi:mono/diheme cytochrome c family protein
LIRTFVFAWATEYVCFVAEIVSAFVFYYYWGRLPERVHTIIVWIYGISAWASLVIIAAITAFMLDPGTWPVDHSFWGAILNRQALPQIIARTGGALLLSSLYVYLHAAITIKDAKLHELIVTRSTRPALLGAVLITLGGVLWHVFLPPSAQAALTGAAVLNVLMALLFAATGIVFVLLFVGSYRKPGWNYTTAFATSLLLFGVIGMSAGEFIREAVRKPYICYGVVLGSQMLSDEVAHVRQQGFLESGPWTRAFVQANYPQVMSADGHIDRRRLAGLAKVDRVALGAVIFQYHCNDCHAVREGYSAVAPLVQGWSPEMLRSLVNNLDRQRFTMPPWAGSPEEADLLVDYLADIAPPQPAGVAFDKSGK